MPHEIHKFERHDFAKAHARFRKFILVILIALFCLGGLWLLDLKNKQIYEVAIAVCCCILLVLCVAFVWAIFLTLKKEDFELKVKLLEDELVIIFSANDKRRICRTYEIDDTCKEKIIISDDIATIELPQDTELLNFLRKSQLNNIPDEIEVGAE